MAKFEELAPNRGVDSVQLGFEWMMVPEGGENLVRLANGTGFSVTPVIGGSRLHVKEVAEKEWPIALGRFGAFFMRKDDRLFRITGKLRGPARLQAMKGALQTKLEVSVHKKVPLTVAFFFIRDQDAQGNLRPRTIFTPSDADSWITTLNDIFGPQANISFKKIKADWLAVTNLDQEVGADHAEILAKDKLKDAKINVFLAGPKIKPSDRSHESHVNGFYHIAQKLIILKDQPITDPWAQFTSPMIQTLAHEIAHLMNYERGAGQGHNFYKSCGYNSDILNTIDASNIKIPHQRVLDWNPW